MGRILSGITGILQDLTTHLTTLKVNLERTLPTHCACCGKAGVWRHGFYERKADRYNSVADSLNPILIPRFYCPHCERTFSVLPESLPPRRWYLWAAQQAVISMLLSGASLNATSQSNPPSRSTCRRWWQRLKEQFLIHSDALRTHFSELGRHGDFNGFWHACLNQISFAKAMLLCQQAGVVVP